MTPTDAMPARILVADDQPDILEAIRLLLKQEGNEVQTVTSPEAVFQAVAAREFDLLVMDLNYSRDTTSGREGINAVSRIRALDRALPIIAMTAWGNIELAVEALHEGVGDFILKPWDDARFVEIARSQIQQGRAQRLAQELGTENRISTLEMLEARDVQRGFLPKEIPRFPGFAISGAWRPAGIIGGDYFDVFCVHRDQAALCIGDVAGKGLAGALLMSNLQAAVKAMAAEARYPQNLCARLNQLIRANVSPHKFITFFYGLLNAECHSLTYTNAGHNAPILLRSDGSIARLEVGGPVLGVFPNEPYAQTNVSLAPGDRLVLFTDGLIEATNDADEEFGEARLISTLVHHRTLTAEALQERVLNAASQFCNSDFEDDATLVVVAAQ
ncbi:MAG TPA: SpoIIE family protein phosphatase [Terriglobia bacterium]|nr:SpoIIE family protein phosphatase [Terriglobia bacterium]